MSGIWRNAAAIGLSCAAVQLLLPHDVAAGAEVATPAVSQYEWAVDPLHPGPDLPPAGRSLFDFLVSSPGEEDPFYDVPFPLPALLARIEAHLQPHRYFSSPLAKVLIPLGRSLQRDAASPDFFMYPRAVVAVDAEPAPVAGHAGMQLTHRLYIGYHEKADVLEVISYNEAAGRFEFQIVKDYRPGGSPRVFYANRLLCTACHQNAAPIFAKPLWDETNANRMISAELSASSREFYGIPAKQSIDIAYAFDNATDNANRYSAYQRIWQEACGRGSSARSARCRAGLFRAMLQYRLSGGRHFDRDDADYVEHVVASLTEHWRRLWPGGLAIPDPDIPNRNPLSVIELGLVETDDRAGELISGLIQNASDVSAGFEPLQSRPPLETWFVTHSDAGRVDEIVAGLSQFMTEADVSRVDQGLARLAEGRKQQHSRIRMPCEFSLDSQIAALESMTIRCASDEGLALDAWIEETPDGERVGRIGRLAIASDHYSDLQVPAWRVKNDTGGPWIEIDTVQPYSQRRVRGADGNAITAIVLELDAPAQPGATPIEGSATVTVADDFDLVDAAIERMIRLTREEGADIFSDRPFRRAVILKAFLDELSVRGLRWCCVETEGLPPAELEAEAGGPFNGAITPGTELFHQYCAICHRSPNRFPPNFLYGNASRVEHQLAACAERIAYRLSMWALPAGERPKTPMPPARALHSFGVSEHEWARHRDLDALRRRALALVRQSNGPPSRADPLARRYSELRSCFGPSDSGSEE